jgi:nucleoporin POM152
MVFFHQWDVLDEPRSVTVAFQPTSGGKGWTKDFTASIEKKTLPLTIGEAGDYAIVGVTGKYCSGDILNPETCKVVELPLPSAEVEFTKIHEWFEILFLFQRDI